MPYLPPKPYPTLPYSLTIPYYPTLPYPKLFIIITHIIPDIYIIYTSHIPCFTLPCQRFNPTQPFPLFTPTLILLVIPYTSFSITLEPLDQFISNFQVTLRLTQKTIWSSFHNGHAWT